MRINLKQKRKGFSLLEVLIMLLVVSYTMISAMSVVAKANISIKNNEKLDVVNNILFKSIELMKSPSPVKLTKAGYDKVVAITNNYYFRLREDGVVKYLEYNSGLNPGAIGTCDTTNFYYYPVTINNNDQNYTVCLQIRIRKTLNPVTLKYYFVAQASVKYNINGTVTSDSLTTYRYENFESYP